jgi:hypothetical protein
MVEGLTTAIVEISTRRLSRRLMVVHVASVEWAKAPTGPRQARLR